MANVYNTYTEPQATLPAPQTLTHNQQPYAALISRLIVSTPVINVLQGLLLIYRSRGGDGRLSCHGWLLNIPINIKRAYTWNRSSVWSIGSKAASKWRHFYQKPAKLSAAAILFTVHSTIHQQATRAIV